MIEHSAWSRRLLPVALGLGVLSWAAAIGFGWYVNHQRGDEQEQAKAVFCRVLGADIQRSLQASENFLKENPRGAPGISVRVIREGIRNRELTYNDLLGVGCDIHH